ncbi:general amidase [Flagelloscypha sp. PMI_526]|nr:general amidase [Flagelloscypha sp. PMI_526]
MANWQSLSAEKRRLRDASFPSAWFRPVFDSPNSDPSPEIILSPKEIQITETEVTTLQLNLANGVWTAVEVYTAYAKRSVVAHRLTNCLTEIFYVHGLTRAKFLDAYLADTGKVVGPLHGIPISIKDMVNLKGVATTLGYVSWIDNIASTNSKIVDILEQAGAVLYVKTNVPQTLMWVETHNLLWGRSLNPYNTTLTTGGSSGGEGALVGARGSAIGVATDIGGSIRVPASFCGLYGLRPSFGRLPYGGISTTSPGANEIKTVVGPVCPSIGGVKLFVQSILAAQPWLNDPSCLRMKWDEDAYALKDRRGRLCFAVMWDDGVVQPYPPVRRAQEMVKNALEKAGHQVISWQAFKHKEACDILRQIWASSDPEELKAHLSRSGEPRLRSMDPSYDPSSEPPKPSNSKSKPPSTAGQLYKLHNKRAAACEEYLQQWNASISSTTTGRPIDAIIAPVAPWPAPPHGKNIYADYTMVWNMLDYTAMSVPVTTVDPELDVALHRDKFLNKMDELCWELYDPSLFKNAPVGIQIVGRTLEEEAAIRFSEIVETALKDYSVKRMTKL